MQIISSKYMFLWQRGLKIQLFEVEVVEESGKNEGKVGATYYTNWIGMGPIGQLSGQRY